MIPAKSANETTRTKVRRSLESRTIALLNDARNVEVGNRIREARRYAGLSQAALARAMKPAGHGESRAAVGERHVRSEREPAKGDREGDEGTRRVALDLHSSTGQLVTIDNLGGNRQPVDNFRRIRAVETGREGCQ